MDGFSHGVSFTVSSTPPPIVPQEQQEAGDKPVSPEERITQLLEENKRLQEMLINQNRESGKKINSLVEQNQLLNKTIQDQLLADVSSSKSKKSSKKKSSVPEEDPFDWRKYWDANFGENAESPDEEDDEEEEEMDSDVEKVVEKTILKKQQELLEQQRKAAEIERQLVEKFNKEEKELHPYSQQVVALWNKFAALNPHQDMVERYNEVIAAAKELFLKPGLRPTKKSPASGFPRGGQAASLHDESTLSKQMTTPNNISGVFEAEMSEDQKKAKELEDYIRARKEFINRRIGFFQTPS